MKETGLQMKATERQLKELGKHPDDDEPVGIYEGKYGSYVKHGKVNATIPKDRDPLQFTMEEAIPLLADRAAKGPAKKGGRGRFAKKAAPAAVAKKVVKKKATKKAAGKKATKKTATQDAEG